MLYDFRMCETTSQLVKFTIEWPHICGQIRTFISTRTESRRAIKFPKIRKIPNPGN